MKRKTQVRISTTMNVIIVSHIRGVQIHWKLPQLVSNKQLPQQVALAKWFRQVRAIVRVSVVTIMLSDLFPINRKNYQ